MTFEEHKSNSWFKTAMIYQIYPRSFKDSTGNGIGDLQGVISKLDYLKWLGIDAIWFNPFFKSPMVDFGYDVSDYTDIDPLFGSLADFNELVAKAHVIGIKIVVDFVPNHSSDQHSWFLESRSSRDNPHRDWYYWRDPDEDGGPPNNWESITGGSAWTYDKQTNQYYLHSFYSCQPDLNWRNPEVRAAMLDILRFWLDRGVDGFRIDMISWLGKDKKLRNEPLNSDFDENSDYHYRKFNHIYSRDDPIIWEFLRTIRNTVDEYEGIILVGEVAYYATFDQLIQYYGDDNLIDIPANFKLLIIPWEVNALKEFISNYDNIIPSFGWPNYQLGNHDQPRYLTRVGVKQSRIAAMLLLTLRGTPFIYYGDEIGMHDVDIPPEEVQDPWEKTEPGKGRDSCRTPMQWSNSYQYGNFSNVKPWLPVGDYTKVNVELQLQDPQSMLFLYHNLIKIRKEYPNLALGVYIPLDEVPKKCFVYYRENHGEKFLVALNFDNKEQIVTISDFQKANILLSTYLDKKGRFDSSELILRSFEGIIMKLL